MQPMPNDHLQVSGAVAIFGQEPKLVVPHAQRKLVNREIRDRLLDMIRENVESP